MPGRVCGPPRPVRPALIMRIGASVGASDGRHLVTVGGSALAVMKELGEETAAAERLGKFQKGAGVRGHRRKHLASLVAVSAVTYVDTFQDTVLIATQARLCRIG